MCKCQHQLLLHQQKHQTLNHEKKPYCFTHVAELWSCAAVCVRRVTYQLESRLGRVFTDSIKCIYIFNGICCKYHFTTNPISRHFTKNINSIQSDRFQVTYFDIPIQSQLSNNAVKISFSFKLDKKFSFSKETQQNAYTNLQYSFFLDRQWTIVTLCH